MYKRQVLSVLAGKAMDRFGKEKFYYPVAAMQVLGGLIAYSIKFLGHAMPLLCVGGTCIMAEMCIRDSQNTVAKEYKQHRFRELP